ncbi:FAD binding domain-containing protein [Parasphingorhabdus pacifica]
MKPYDYRRADDINDAVATITDHPGGKFIGGGTNLVDHLKLGIVEPDLLVDVSRLSLDAVEKLPGGGVRIGATVRNSDAAAHSLVRVRYPVLAEALLSGASAQLRNSATTGGNLLQRTRCPYFQDLSTACNKRSPGTGCSAVEGHHRDQAIIGASSSCVATHPSDMAVALTALDADVQVLGRGGERTVPVGELHRLPGDDPSRDTVLEHGDLITAVDVPELPRNTRSAYRKVRERASYAFALVSVAATLDVEDGIVRDARIALGGIAHKPWRASVAERELRGGPASEEAFRSAATAELRQAVPLPGNAFKVAMAVNTIVAVLRSLSGGGQTDRTGGR